MNALDLDLFSSPAARQATAPLRRSDGIVRRFVPVSVVREDPLVQRQNTKPESILTFWRTIIARQPDYEPDKESLCVIILNGRLVPVSWHRVSLGSLTETSATAREIFRPVILAGGYGFVLCHNHPSGDPRPSDSDVRITRRLVEAAQLMDLKFIDHVVTTDEGREEYSGERYYSFMEAGIVH